jgi:hypothetical protein
MVMHIEKGTRTESGLVATVDSYMCLKIKHWEDELLDLGRSSIVVRIWAEWERQISMMCFWII